MQCSEGDVVGAHTVLKKLWDEGYSCMDILGTLFKVCKSAPLAEPVKLEFIKEIGFCHMRVADGLNTYLQLAGLVARLSQRKLDTTPTQSY
jgi:replication factor C subunit 2/4